MLNIFYKFYYFIVNKDNFHTNISQQADSCAEGWCLEMVFILSYFFFKVLVVFWKNHLNTKNGSILQIIMLLGSVFYMFSRQIIKSIHKT